MMEGAAKTYRRKVVIRGEDDGLRIGSEVFSPEDEGLAPGIPMPDRTSQTPFATIEIEDEGNKLFVVAHRGFPGEPNLWSLGLSCPTEDELPRWTTYWKSKPGSPSPELAIVLTLKSRVRILER